MDKVNTKQRILDASLALFSMNGFDGVSVKEIAGMVGIKDSSLYKHFKNKQEIFDTLVSEMSKRFEEIVALYKLPQGEIEKIAAEYGENDSNWLKNACEAIFLFFLKDPQASKFRRLLMVEQYKNEDIAKIFKRWFIDDAINFQTTLFVEMIKQGYFIDVSPKVIAIQFYSPFFLLLAQYDNEPEKEEEALNLFKEHIDQFTNTYQIRSEDN